MGRRPAAGAGAAAISAIAGGLGLAGTAEAATPADAALADPTGEVRARLGGGEDVLVAEVDRETVARTRGTIPIL